MVRILPPSTCLSFTPLAHSSPALLEQNIQSVEGENAALEAAKQQLEQSVRSLQRERESLQQRLRTATEDSERLSAQVGEVERDLQQVQNRHQEETQRHTRRFQELSQEKDRITGTPPSLLLYPLVPLPLLLSLPPRPLILALRTAPWC